MLSKLAEKSSHAWSVTKEWFALLFKSPDKAIDQLYTKVKTRQISEAISFVVTLSAFCITILAIPALLTPFGLPAVTSFIITGLVVPLILAVTAILSYLLAEFVQALIRRHFSLKETYYAVIGAFKASLYWLWIGWLPLLVPLMFGTVPIGIGAVLLTGFFYGLGESLSNIMKVWIDFLFKSVPKLIYSALKANKNKSAKDWHAENITRIWIAFDKSVQDALIIFIPSAQSGSLYTWGGILALRAFNPFSLSRSLGLLIGGGAISLVGGIFKVTLPWVQKVLLRKLIASIHKKTFKTTGPKQEPKKFDLNSSWTELCSNGLTRLFYGAEENLENLPKDSQNIIAYLKLAQTSNTTSVSIEKTEDGHTQIVVCDDKDGDNNEYEKQEVLVAEPTWKAMMSTVKRGSIKTIFFEKNPKCQERANTLNLPQRALSKTLFEDSILRSMAP